MKVGCIIGDRWINIRTFEQSIDNHAFLHGDSLKERIVQNRCAHFANVQQLIDFICCEQAIHQKLDQITIAES